jgi:SAM-dependent methyltransferase
MDRAIRALNLAHYRDETSFYSHAPLRPTERALADATARGRKILDVGCGAGRVTGALTAMGHDITGLDIVPDCLEAARQNPARVLKLVEGDMCNMPLESAQFDEVWCLRFSFNALLSNAERQSALREMFRVCKPGGRVLIESFNYWHGGRLGAYWFANIGDVLVRKLRTVAGSPSPQLPNHAVLYMASKTAHAPPGFTYLMTPGELRRLARESLPTATAVLCDDFEITTGTKRRRPTKYLEYSLWLRIQK